MKPSAARKVRAIRSASSLVDRPLEWNTKVIMLSGGVMTSLAWGAIASVLPQMEAALAHGPTDSLLIKQLLGVVGLSMVIGAPLAGLLLLVGYKIIADRQRDRAASLAARGV